jgi:D-glycero-D-manno-heptose 1,7-bisphosphate phosphatase
MGTDSHGWKRAVFLDRDGVINRNVWNPATRQYESPLTADDFALLPGVLAALSQLRNAGFLLFIVSNQPNEAIHQKLIAATVQAGIAFAGCYYCFHHPQGCVRGYAGACVCRKPSPYFLLEARLEFGVDLRRSWMIGDRESDVQCGRAAGTRTILIESHASGKGAAAADHVVSDLCQATRLIVFAEVLDAGSSPMGQERRNP